MTSVMTAVISVFFEGMADKVRSDGNKIDKDKP